MAPGTPGDPTLALRDRNGAQLAFNDDAGGSRNSRIDITAPYTGAYDLDVGGFQPRRGSDTLTE